MRRSPVLPRSSRVYRKSEVAVFGSHPRDQRGPFPPAEIRPRGPRDEAGHRVAAYRSGRRRHAAAPVRTDAECPWRDSPRRHSIECSCRCASEVRAGEIRAAFVMEDDIAADPAIAAALPKLDFLAVHASNESETTRLADVVFPARNVRGTEWHVHEFPGDRPADPSVGDDAGSGPCLGRPGDEPVGQVRDGIGPGGAARSATPGSPGWKVIAGIASVGCSRVQVPPGRGCVRRAGIGGGGIQRHDLPFSGQPRADARRHPRTDGPLLITV